MSDEIPFHVQVEIIKRLPVVSLLQFRSVSKAWKSLIDSPDFIAAHCVTQPEHLLLRYEDPVESAEKYVSIVDDDSFPHQRFVHTIPMSVKLLKRPTIVGSSHGLLCLHGYYGEQKFFSPDLDTQMVVLWNPSIRKSIAVSVSNNSNPDHETDLGFVVCPVTSDPKIIEITQYINSSSYHCEAKVYTVSSGKWRSLSSSSNLPSKRYRTFWPQVIVDRIIYWCAFDPLTMDSRSPNHNLIMWFDTTDEKFGVIELPDSLRLHCSTELLNSKIRESLVLLEYESSCLKRSCVVWKMENGVEKSFTKLFTVQLSTWSRTITILGFRKSGQAIMEVEYEDSHILQNGELVVYEPNSERFNDLEIYGTNELFVLNSFMETLVLLGQSDCVSY